MGQPNLYALDILNDSNYKRISDPGTKAAVATIATQITTYRSAATGVTAAKLLRDLIEDILRGQGLQTTVNALPPVTGNESLISDGTAVTALTTIRTYLSGLATVTNPPVGQLPAKNAFGPLCRCIAESI
jgi:hypothetical protein